MGFGSTLDALKHLRKLRKLYLYGCVDWEGSLQPRNLRELVALDVEACFWLAGWGSRLGDPAEAAEAQHLRHGA